MQLQVESRKRYYYIMQCLNSLILPYLTENKHYVFAFGRVTLNTPTVRLGYQYEERLGFRQLWHGISPPIVIFDQEGFDFYLEILLGNDYVFRSPIKVIIVSYSEPPASKTLVLASFGYPEIIYVNPLHGTIYKMSLYERTSATLALVENNLPILYTASCSNISHVSVPKIREEGDFNFQDIHVNLCKKAWCAECKDGMELKIFEIIFRKLNITPKVIDLRIFDEKCDFLFGYATPYVLKELRFTTSYLFDTYSWFVAMPKPRPKILYPVRIFTVLTWIMILISLILFAFSYGFVKNYKNKKMGFQNLYQSSAKSLANCFFLLIEQNNLFKMLKPSETILVFFVTYFAFALNAIYKSQYTFFLITEQYDFQVNSYEDIISHNMSKALPEIEIPRIISDEYKFRMGKCGTSFNCLENCANNENMAVLALDRNARRFWRVLNPNGKKRLRRLEVPFMSIHYVAFAMSGHPFYPTFNRFLLYLVETGITNRIISAFDDELYDAEIIVSNTELTLRHMMAAFFVFIVGTASSFAVWLWEIFSKKV